MKMLIMSLYTCVTNGNKAPRHEGVSVSGGIAPRILDVDTGLR